MRGLFTSQCYGIQLIGPSILTKYKSVYYCLTAPEEHAWEQGSNEQSIQYDKSNLRPPISVHALLTKCYKYSAKLVLLM